MYYNDIRNGLYHATLNDTICAIQQDIMVLINDHIITIIFTTEMEVDTDAMRRYNRNINPAKITIKGKVSQETLDEIFPF